MTWDPTLYQMFKDQRLRPALDLITQITSKNFNRIVDLGCGPGTVTNILAQKWADANICGIDNSAEMLASAQKNFSHIHWQKSDIEQFSFDVSPDLIFSNACLHWLDNHAALFTNLIKSLKSGGTLAVQMPNNFATPSHQLIRDTLKEDKWSHYYDQLSPKFPVHETEFYYETLDPYCSHIDIWETTYIHELEGDNPIVNWTKSTTLLPVLKSLRTENEQKEFLESYSVKCHSAYKRLTSGKTLFPFKRLFIVAQKI